MGHKLVCFKCRITRNLSLNITTWESANKFCVKCQSEMKMLPHRFRPPKTDDIKKWEVVFSYLKTDLDMNTFMIMKIKAMWKFQKI